VAVVSLSPKCKSIFFLGRPSVDLNVALVESGAFSPQGGVGLLMAGAVRLLGTRTGCLEIGWSWSPVFFFLFLLRECCHGLSCPVSGSSLIVLCAQGGCGPLCFFSVLRSDRFAK